MITGLMNFVEYVENNLGWLPTPPEWKSRVHEAGILKRKIATNPRLYSWANLELAVQHCVRSHTRVQHPAAVCFYVEDALASAVVHDESELTRRVEEAIRHELGTRSPGWIGRVNTLTRATGPARGELLARWIRE